MQSSDWISLFSLLVAVAAFVASVWAYNNSKEVAALTHKATMYPHRKAVYDDVERFVSSWFRHGRPDMSSIPKLANTWHRATFICSETACDYIREVWDAAAKTVYLNNIVDGKKHGDRDAAIDKVHEDMQHYADIERLKQAFSEDLKIK